MTELSRRVLPGADQDLFNESNGRTDGTMFASLYGHSYESRCLLQSDYCSVLVDVSPIVAGHLLVVPRRPIPNMASLRGHERRDVAQVVDLARGVLADVFGPPTAFEHGAAGFGAPGPCVDYAHLHLAPIGDVAFVERASALSLRPRRTGGTLADAAYDRSEYFFWDSPSDPRSFTARISAGLVVPRQFFRSVVGEQLGVEDWDWALGRSTSFGETIERLCGAF